MVLRHLSNLTGWRTRRKIIVFESDDWGSIRMPSTKAFERLSSKGINLISGDSERYNRFDTLASKEDLELLFEILTSIRDKDGHAAVFTPVSLVANPDFAKIEAGNFKTYHYERFTETLHRYHREAAFDYWKFGIQEGIFVPQFHGREHLNVAAWIRKLNSQDPATVQAFKEGLWGYNNQGPISYQAAFDLEFANDLALQKTAISEGLELFSQLFGYRATFFVPPNGPFNHNLEKVAFEQGIRYLSTAKLHREPLGEKKYKKRFHWLGKKSKNGLTYITRNAFFEPSQGGKDWVDSSLADIELAFQYNKPANISTHRVNYIGSLDPKNRDFGLKQLNKLLKKIVQTWPAVEFLDADTLGKIIAADEK